MKESTLSKAEIEILYLAAEGYTAKHISILREIPHQTARTRLASIKKKINASILPHAVYIAMKQGLIK